MKGSLGAPWLCAFSPMRFNLMVESTEALLLCSLVLATLLENEVFLAVGLASGAIK